MPRFNLHDKDLIIVPRPIRSMLPSALPRSSAPGMRSASLGRFTNHQNLFSLGRSWGEEKKDLRWEPWNPYAGRLVRQCSSRAARGKSVMGTPDIDCVVLCEKAVFVFCFSIAGRRFRTFYVIILVRSWQTLGALLPSIYSRHT